MSRPPVERSASFGFVRRFLSFFLPVVLLVGISAFLICRTEHESVHMERAGKVQEALNVGIAAIGRSLQVAEQDLLYLASRMVNLRVLENPSERNLASLASDWAEFSGAKQIYDQIRWIDESGMERVRVDFESGRPVIIPGGMLQSKRDRYYFIDAIKLEAHQIYVSPLDLNIERGQVEVPYNPTIRLGIPMVDSKGTKRGLLLVNYSARRLLSRFASNSIHDGNSAWLVNQAGYWLKGHSSDDEFGFMLGRNDLTIGQRYPEAWRRISSEEKGQFETGEGLWIFSTVRPLQGDSLIGSASGEANVPVLRQSSSNTYQWKAIFLLPRAQYNAGLSSFMARLAGGSLLVLGLFFLAIWRLVRSQMAEQDVRASLEQTVDERTRSLQEANQSLSIEQLRLRSLLQTIPDNIWLKDQNGIYLWCNPSAARFFGVEEKDIVGHSDYDLIPRELADAFNEKDKEAIKEGKAITSERYLTYADNGKSAMFEITKAPVRTSSGKLVGVLGIGHDITARMEAQERERRYKNIYRALSATNEAIIHQLDETALFERVCRIAVDYGEMCLAWIGIADIGAKKIVTVANYGKAIGYSENINVSILPDLPEGNGPTGTAFRENRYIVISDYSADERVVPWRDLAAQYGIKSGAVFPILRAGKPYAIFSIHSEKLDAFDDKVISLLDRMAGNLSFALDNFDRDAFRREAERTVKESEVRLRRIIEEAPFPMMVHADDGQIVQNNRSLTQITGYASSEIPTVYDWTEKAYGEQAAQVREAIKHLYGIKSQVDNGEFIVHCKDGTTRIWHFVSSPIGELDDGRRAVISMAVDVTERTKAEEALREQEQLLSLFVENAPAAIAMFDKDMHYLVVSRRLLDEFHTSQANLIGLSHYQVVPNMPEHFKEAHRRALAGETVKSKEDVLERKDGRKEWVQWEVRPWFIHGEIGGILLFVDFITDRKEAEERERQLKNMYHTLSATNQAIIHCTSEQELFSSVCRIVVRFSQMALVSIGVLEAEGKYISLAIEGSGDTDINDESLPCMQQGLLHGQGAEGAGIRENEAIFINDISTDKLTQDCRQDAARHGFKSIAALPLDRGQKAYAMLIAYSKQAGAFNDETASLLSEMSDNISFALNNFDREAARERAEDSMRLAALVYQDSSEGMMVTDADNRIIAVNPAFESITGYKAEEVLGKNPNLLKSGRQDDEFYRAMWKSISATGRWRGELWNRARNGSEFAELITINTSFNPDGSVLRRVALFSDITKKKQSDDLIWHQANFDALTGLPNRNLFRDHLRHEIRNARRTNLPIALMFLDLDGFKDINDTLGHDMGDLLLKEVAERLKRCVREIDTVARLGGDEFTVILTELQDPGNVNRVASHILGEIARPVTLNEDVAHVSASIGITLYPQDASELEGLLKNADQAMYAAKQGGRNQYHFFTQEMQEAAISRMRLVNDLRGALESSQFEIVYQPIIEIKNGCISKAEALIRWRHPTRGMISPEEFISAAEDTGMITSFGNWMMQEAVKQVAKWREWHHPAFQISVNVSPAQLKNGNISLSTWSEYFSQTGVGGDAIVVEITEGLLLDSNEKVNRQILAFRDAGIQVALDDFGTGYSSLSYLKKFDIDYIKIDQSFVRNLEHDADDMVLCEAMIVMAHKLGMKVIAEGVETEEQRQKLSLAECDYAQGYLFSKPLSAGELDDLLRIGSSYCQDKR